MNVLLGVPTTRDFPTTYVRSLWTSQLQGELGWYPVFGQSIDIGRNRICDQFLTRYKNFDYLIMHDSDASWHPGAIERLVSHNLPVVTAVIFKRGLPTVPTIGKYIGIDAEGKHLYSFAETVNKILDVVETRGLSGEEPAELLLDKTDNDLMEIDGCGAHFMAIRRDVLEAIGENWYQAPTPNGGEDFDFCRKVQKAGFKLYADFSVFTGHHLGGTMMLGLREFLLYRDGKKKVDLVWKM